MFIMIDPSHATGKSKDVPKMTMTAIAFRLRLGAIAFRLRLGAIALCARPEAIALLEFFAHNL